MIAANYTYKVAKPDGLTIGHFIGGLILQHVLGKPGIEFDGRKFEHLGVPAQDTTTVGITKVSGVTGIDNWLSTKTTLKFGGVGPGNGQRDPLAVVFADADNDKLAGPAGLCDQRRLHLHGEDMLGELLPGYDSMQHVHLSLNLRVTGRSFAIMVQNRHFNSGPAGRQQFCSAAAGFRIMAIGPSDYVRATA